MQPHAPYIGDQAQELREQLANESGLRFVNPTGPSENADSDDRLYNLLEVFSQGYISRKELEAVYKENLNCVLEIVAELLTEITGKSVISSDHSESFGDFNGIYGHKNHALSRELREVPWLEIDGDRRDTYPEPPAGVESVEEEVVKRNLRELGYLE